MGMSITASRASTAMLSQAIKPQPNVVPHQIQNNKSPQKVVSLANELLTLSTEGHLGRHVNKVA